ncbi:hypothetical protein V8F06_014078 [Rhypophila decipiens]
MASNNPTELSGLAAEVREKLDHCKQTEKVHLNLPQLLDVLKKQNTSAGKAHGRCPCYSFSVAERQDGPSVQTFNTFSKILKRLDDYCNSINEAPYLKEIPEFCNWKPDHSPLDSQLSRESITRIVEASFSNAKSTVKSRLIESMVSRRKSLRYFQIINIVVRHQVSFNEAENILNFPELRRPDQEEKDCFQVSEDDSEDVSPSSQQTETSEDANTPSHPILSTGDAVPSLRSLESIIPPAPTRIPTECGYCRKGLPDDQLHGQKWIDHFMRDLTPYVCLVDDCPHPHPDALFDNSSDWMDHMEEEEHNPLTECPLCPESPSLAQLSNPKLLGHIEVHMVEIAMLSVADMKL